MGNPLSRIKRLFTPFTEEKESHADPLDLLLAILSEEVSTDTIIKKAKRLLQVEKLPLNLKEMILSTEEGQTQHETRQNMFKVLHKHYSSELMTALQSGKYSTDILEASIRYVLNDNDVSSKREILDIAGRKLRTEISNTYCMVWGGLNYREGRKGEVSLICFHKGYLKMPPAIFLGLPVLYRLHDKIEREPFEVCLSEEYIHTSLTEETLEKATKLINTYGEGLFAKHTNLEALSVSSVISSKSKGLVTTVSIVFYCKMKGVIPIGESHFPSELRMKDIFFPTDVREGLFSFGMHEDSQVERPTDRIDKLRMGCSIGRENSGYSGTLGPFVRLDTDAIGFITCAHVVGLDQSLFVNANVVQPGDGDSLLALRTCGRIKYIEFDPDREVGIDAALVEVDTRRRSVEPAEFIWSYPGQIEEADFSPENPPSFRGGRIKTSIYFRDVENKIVIKCGKATGLTKGCLAVKGTMIKILTKPHPLHLPRGMNWKGKEHVVMKGQYLVENMGYPFFTIGDSGAGVYLVEDGGSLSLIGLAIGMLNDYTVVTPIGPVLNSLQLNADNLQFPEPMETEQSTRL